MSTDQGFVGQAFLEAQRAGSSIVLDCNEPATCPTGGGGHWCVRGTLFFRIVFFNRLPWLCCKLPKSIFFVCQTGLFYSCLYLVGESAEGTCVEVFPALAIRC